MLKFIAGITNLIGNPPFSLIVLWSLMRSFGDGIARVASNCLTNFFLELKNPSSPSRGICLLTQTGQSPSGRDQVRSSLKGVRIPTACSL